MWGKSCSFAVGLVVWMKGDYLQLTSSQGRVDDDLNTEFTETRGE